MSKYTPGYRIAKALHAAGVLANSRGVVPKVASIIDDEAAATDLLAALEGLVNVVDPKVGRETLTIESYFVGPLVAARAAIAKATSSQ